MRKPPVLSKILALLVLLVSAIMLWQINLVFYFEQAQFFLRTPPEWVEEKHMTEDFFRLRREVIFFIIHYLSLAIVVFSSLIILIRQSRFLHIILGSASLVSLIMYLIRYLQFSPFSFHEDFMSSLFPTAFCLINLVSVIYFLPQMRKS